MVPGSTPPQGGTWPMLVLFGIEPSRLALTLALKTDWEQVVPYRLLPKQHLRTQLVSAAGFIRSAQ